LTAVTCFSQLSKAKMGIPAADPAVKLGYIYAVLEWGWGLEIGFELALFFGAVKRRFSL